MNDYLDKSVEKAETMYKESENLARFKKTTDLIGLPVQNPNGENLGEIEDIVIDFNERIIKYAIISFGGFLGFGERLFAVPWEIIDFQEAELIFVLDIDKESLKDAPKFAREKWPIMSMEWADEVHQYYGIRMNLQQPIKPESKKEKYNKEKAHDMRL
ncbi:MAG: PRC-barrel domain containing protein [Firmicutes bacterium]|nr:PRC-barrel domain containing protein [Bacillota bacterium]